MVGADVMSVLPSPVTVDDYLARSGLSSGTTPAWPPTREMLPTPLTLRPFRPFGGVRDSPITSSMCGAALAAAPRRALDTMAEHCAASLGEMFAVYAAEPSPDDPLTPSSSASVQTPRFPRAGWRSRWRRRA